MAYITGITYWDKEKGKWKDTCLPLASKKKLIPTKTSVTRRAISFGLKPIGKWEIEKNVHYREFRTDFGKILRAFIIPRKK